MRDAALPGHPGRWIAAAFLAALAVVAAARVGARWNAKRSPVARSAFPELATADPDLVDEIAGELDSGRKARFDVSSRAADLLIPRLDADPDRARRALVAAMLRVYGTPDELSVSSGVYADESREGLAVWLREHPAPDTDAALCRIAEARAFDEDLRRKAFVALARPGNPAALEALTDVALDDAEPSNVRREVLSRISRCKAPLPARFRALLGVAWGQIAIRAAVALSESGDHEAPSLLLEGLRSAARQRYSVDLGFTCASALLGALGPDSEFGPRLAAARDAMRLPKTWTNMTSEQIDQSERDERTRIAELVAEISAWLDAHPERFDTEFERARRAYFRDPRRAREMAQPSPLAALPDSDDFDLAAVLLARSDGPSDGELLGALDRLARAVRSEAGPAPTPARWIDAMNARLLPRRDFVELPAEPSELWYVLATGYGNCMGRSSLFLAVAERLGLPLHGVAVPQHVFVRWDDGKFRRNIETTERGAEHDDRWYKERGGGLAVRDEDVASGAFLSNLGKREFLALALVNRSYSSQGRVEPARTLAWADCAVRLAPRSANPRICRAEAAIDSGAPALNAAAEDLRIAESARRLWPAEAVAAARVELALGCADDALRLADAGRTLAPGDVALGAVRVRALTAQRRFGEARRVADAVLAQDPKSADAQFADIELRIAVGDSSWRARLHAATDDPLRAPGVHLGVATALLDGVAGRPASPAEASSVLGELAGISADDGTEPGRERPLRDIRRYLRLRLRASRAVGDEKDVAWAEAELRRTIAAK